MICCAKHGSLSDLRSESGVWLCALCGLKEAGGLFRRRQAHRVILFDEAYEAHPDVMNIMLELLDDGRSTDCQVPRTASKSCLWFGARFC